MATNIVRAVYNEVVDLNTMPNELTVLGIHAPCTSIPYNKLRGLFINYRKYRYLGCTVSLAPAATLPMDPAGVGYEAGDPTVDPRDLLNPILFHGTHGMTLGAAMDTAFRSTGVTRTSAGISRFDVPDADANPWWGSNNYYDALSDPSWKKYSPMAPFRIRNLHPMVHRLVTTIPVPVPDNGYNNVLTPTEDPSFSVMNNVRVFESEIYGLGTGTQGDGKQEPLVQQMFTNGVEPLGWLDTYAQTPVGDKVAAGSTYYPEFQFLPRAFMGVIVFPPAYSVKLCFRLSIKHYFVFREFVTADSRTGVSSGLGYNNALDDSVIPSTSEASLQSSSLEISNGEVELLTASVS